MSREDPLERRLEETEDKLHRSLVLLGRLSEAVRRDLKRPEKSRMKRFLEIQRNIRNLPSTPEAPQWTFSEGERYDGSFQESLAWHESRQSDEWLLQESVNLAEALNKKR